MKINNILSNILNSYKKIEVNKLPSRGLFYYSDFNISIKRANIKDIEDYERNFTQDINLIIMKVQKIVENNVILENGYKFEDIKSIDIIYIFFEIVKFSNKKPIYISYFNEIEMIEKKITFEHYNFYYSPMDHLMKYYNSKDRQFDIGGYSYTLPTIGVENSVSNILLNNTNDDFINFNGLSYNFFYFLKHKNSLTEEEMINLLKIFNYDIEPNELKIIDDIIEKFQDMQKYFLKDGDYLVDVNSEMNLKDIWK